MAAAAFSVLCAAAQAAEPVTARQEPVPMTSLFVPVCLDTLANDAQAFEAPSRRVTVASVPFDLPAGASGALFLRAAEWPDWKTDPSSYYAAYDQAPKEPDPRRPFFQIPVADYECVYLLAAADNDPALSPNMTLRIGAFDGSKRTTIHDIPITVPRAADKKGANVIRVLPAKTGNVFVLKVPLALAIAQDFPDRLALDVEVTKEVRLAIHRPDPCRFTYRPLGLPSGVRLFGVTFRRSAAQMTVEGAETGNIFVEPQTPAFTARLRCVDVASRGRGPYAVEAEATGFHGGSGAFTSQPIAPALLTPGTTVALPVKVDKRGAYALTVRLKAGAATLLERKTTFALLPPDTRQHRESAPWGTWDFCGGHYTPAEAGAVGPLYVKAGLRYGMFQFPQEERQKYGVLQGNDPTIKNAETAEKLAKAVADGQRPAPPRILIFHEDAISGPHVTRVPTLFTGRAPYRFDEKEQARFQALWDGALAACRAAREHFPKAVIYFGNGNPQLMEEFLARKFPADLFDARGNEAGSFQRPPESQPPDWVANNAGLWMDRQILDHYGCKDKPVYQCYEICYPGTAPGFLSLRTQAAYIVRHILHSMAWKVPVVRAGIICDVGNSYYHSNWGSSGLCFAQPNVSPKPSYAAVATLTQTLDGAAFVRVVPCPAPSVYALEFRRPDGKSVTALWTPRGKRQVLAQLPPGAGQAVAVDMVGNETPLPPRDGKAEVEISPDPMYLVTPAPLAALSAGRATHESPPPVKSVLISSLASLKEWTVEDRDDAELEMYNPLCPRRKGQFTWREVAEFEGMANAIEVSPKLPAKGSPYLPMYGGLRHVKGVEIPGEPTEISLWVNGNGGWGRVIFELEDAGGQRWISLGCEARGEPTRWMADWMPAEEFKALKTSNHADWNTDDAWGRSVINFEGWRRVRFPLPGNYPGERYHWPYSSQWRFSGDGVVKYPLKFKRLVVTIPEKVVRFTECAAVPRQTILLKELVATYAPPEEAFRPE